MLKCESSGAFVSLRGGFVNRQRCHNIILVRHRLPLLAGALLLRSSPGEDEQLTLIKTHRLERFREGRGGEIW